MPKYTICGITKSTVALGECEAETPEKAIKKFKNTPRAEWAVKMKKILLIISLVLISFNSFAWMPNPAEEMVVNYECGLSKTPIQDNATLDVRLSFIPDVGIFSTNGEVQCIFSPDIFEVGQTYYGFVRAVNIWGLRGLWQEKDSNGKIMLFHYLRPSIIRGNGFDIRIENNVVVFEIF